MIMNNNQTAAMCLAGLVLLVAAITCDAVTSTITVPVAPSCSLSQVCDGGGGGGGNGSVTLDQALKMVESGASGVVLELLPGCHCVGGYTFVENATDLTLAGLGRQEEVVIRCAKGRGLPFFNTTRLSITNLTVDGCGLTGTNLTSFHDRLNTLIDFFYEIPTRYRIAVLCGICSDFKLTNAVIKNSSGLGFLGVNIIGHSFISNADFVNNTPPQCVDSGTIESPTLDHTGGGAVILYHNFFDLDAISGQQALAIQDSTFLKNSYCSIWVLFDTYYSIFKGKRRADFVNMAGGGGLFVTVTQVQYAVNITVESCIFEENASPFGAAAGIAYFAGASDCHTRFQNCTFDNNGRKANYSADNANTVTICAGLLFIKDLTRIDKRSTDWPPVQLKLSSVVVVDSTFTYNSAATMSALYVGSNYVSRPIGDFVLVSRCTFQANHGFVRGIMFFFEQKWNGQQDGLKIYLNDISVIENVVYSSRDRSYGTPAHSGAILRLESIEATLSGNSTFERNSATAIQTVRSVLHFCGNVTFFKNSGVFGGALNVFSSSFLVVHNYSHIVFLNNSAAVHGGAIYTYATEEDSFSNSIDADAGCFLYFDSIDALCVPNQTCPDVRASKAHITFSGNSAESGGILFGSTLETCSWGQQLKETLNKTNDFLITVLYYDLRSVFDFGDTSPLSTSLVTTPPYKIVINNSSDKHIRIHPGQKLYLNITAEDVFGQQIQVGLTTSDINELPTGEKVVATLGSSGYWFTSQDTTTPMTVTSYPSKVNALVTIFSADSFAQVSLAVHLGECPSPVFNYNNVTLACECSTQLDSTAVECSAETLELKVPSPKWLGFNKDQELVYHSCVFDFCEAGTRTFVGANFDVQCHSGYSRRGLLCGECRKNYSLVFGSMRCLNCQNNYGVFWILFIAVGGILLVCTLFFLRFTIANGYLNGILLYSNVISMYQTAFFFDFPADYYLLPFSFLNLNLGIETCFIQEMNMLTKIWLQFLFPVYLFVIILVITMLVKCSRKFSQLLSGSDFSVTKVFATLIILSYTSVFQACALVLAPIDVITLSGKHTLRWRLDPSQDYFSGFHAALGIYAIVVTLVYIIPFPLLLIFQGIAFKFKLVRRLKPIYDVFGAPFRPQYRYWIGIRLLLRFIPFTLSATLTDPLKVLLLGISTMVLFFIQVIIWPFEGTARNAFDLFFLAHIVLLTIESLYFRSHVLLQCGEDLDHCHRTRLYVMGCTVLLAFLAVLLITFWHGYQRIPPAVRLRLQAAFLFGPNNDKDCDATPEEVAEQHGNLDMNSEITGSMNLGIAINSTDIVGSLRQARYSILREPQLEESVAVMPL